MVQVMVHVTPLDVRGAPCHLLLECEQETTIRALKEKVRLKVRQCHTRAL
jgi:hypothetical protein